MAKSLLPAEGQAGRFGGEELVAIIPASDPKAAAQNAQNFAESLRAHIAEASFPARNSMAAKITVSAGVAANLEPTQQATVLLKMAMAALDQAKSKGRNCVVATDFS
jgi:diguanylate cyclase (GGDEF)-like protein